MSLPTRLRSFVRSLVHRSTLENEMKSEVWFHVESRAADLEAAGLTRSQALRQAKVEFGPVATHTDGMRQALGLRWFDELRGDLLYSARMFRRTPGFALVAIASLALGIGANTVIFTLAKGVLLDRLAVRKPGELRLFAILLDKKSPVHSVWGSFFRNPDGRTYTSSFSYPAYQLLRQQNQAHPVIGDLFAFKDPRRMTISVDGHADVVSPEVVSGNYYEQLGVHASLGRAIKPSDDAVPGAGAVAVISDGLWSRMFGRSPLVIGKTIELNLIPVTIVGVNPPDFTGAAIVQSSPDVFLPLSMQPVLFPTGKASLLSNKDNWWLQVMARTKPGVKDSEARAAISVWLEQDIRATMKVGKDDQMPTFVLSDGSQGMASLNRTFKQPIFVLLAMTALVLLLASANLANLLLARSSSRQRELAVRMALGATRARVMRQVLTESLLLSSLGGTAGLMLGYLCRSAIPHLLTSAWDPTKLNTRFDLKIFAFTAALSILTGVLFGIGPAWKATRTEVNTGLKESSAASTRRRKGLAGPALVVFQVALSMLLVAGGGLFARTLVNLSKAEIGFDPSGILLFDVQAPEARYPKPRDITLHARIEEQIAAVPGVQSVTLTQLPMLASSMSNTDFVPTDQPKPAEGTAVANVNEVGRTFFSTFRIPILYGRGFGATDTTTSPAVAVVNEAIVKRFYPNQNPIGRTFKGDNDKVYQIVGVSRDSKYTDLRETIDPTFYILYNQSAEDSEMTYAVKTSIPTTDLLPRLRAAVQLIDRDLPLRDIRTQQEQIDATISQERLFATLTGAFGLLALTLACIGIYGIMAYDVARRTNEIGVRMALGARAGMVLRMILRESIWMAVAGIALGVAGAFGLTRFVSTMLYGLKAMDAATMIGAAAVLFVVAIAAGYGPARRASRIDPIVALRHE
ncbi:putative permease [Granulicella aggregans]|uniref:Putative permease n=1 Tax=Granulicella aggregans TaxID=474949 RepID=A0A7W8E594_9BACT|nr:ABC transporter permease [Granulicella aggregans]MBB5059059.1 putative permease [Granulicella aggregans]